MHLESLFAAITAGRHRIGDGADPVLEHRAIDEVRPDVQNVDELVGEAGEAPGLVSVHGERAVVVEEAVIKIDHALNEFRREGPHAAIVEQVDAGGLAACILEHRVVAEMRIAVDHAVMAERVPPGAEHGARDGVALLQRPVRVVEQPAPIEPSHGEEAPRRQLRQDVRHTNDGIVLEDDAVEPRVLGLELVVELFAQARRNLF